MVKLPPVLDEQQSMLQSIKYNAEKIEQCVLKIQSMNEDLKTHKSMKPAKFYQLDNVKPIVQARSQEILLSDAIALESRIS